MGGLCRVGSFVWTFRHRSIYIYMPCPSAEKSPAFGVWKYRVYYFISIYIIIYIFYIYLYILYIHIIYIIILYIYIHIIYIYICLYKYLRPTISQLHGTVLAFTSGCDTSPLRGHDSPPQLGSSTAMDRKALVTFYIH